MDPHRDDDLVDPPEIPPAADLAELERARPRPVDPETAAMIRECFEEFYGPAQPAHMRAPRAAA